MKSTPTILLLIAIALLVACPSRTELQGQDKKDANAEKQQEKKDDDKNDSEKKKDDNKKKKGNGKKKKKRSPVTVANHLTRLAKIKLSDDQKNKLEPISKDYRERYARARKKYEAAVNETTRNARSIASEKFQAKGYRGDKLRGAIDKAVELTRVEKAAVDIFRKEKQDLDSSLRKVLWAALNVKERQIVGLPEKLKEESP